MEPRRAELRKIVLLSPGLGAEGRLLYWGPILDALRRHGFRISLCTGNELDLRTCLELERLPLKLFRWRAITWPSFQALSSIATISADVVLVNEFSLVSLYASLVLHFRPGIRTLLLVENHPKYLAGYGITRTGFFQWLRRIQCLLVDRILTNNDEGSAYLREELGVDPAKTSVGPYLTSSFNSQPKVPQSAGDFNIASIGRLIERKGYHRLIEEVTLLPQEAKSKLRIHIYGEGEARQRLQSLIDSRCLNETIRLCGQLPYDALSHEISNFDAFIVPTLADYRSLVAFEAISAGLPLLISIHDGAINEVLRDGVNGYRIDPARAGDIGNKIQLLMARRDEIDAMRLASLERARKFTVDKAVRVLASAIEMCKGSQDKQTDTKRFRGR